MNADLAFVRPVMVASGIVAAPLYFPANARQLFGWLQPFGYEALCPGGAVDAVY